MVSDFERRLRLQSGRLLPTLGLYLEAFADVALAGLASHWDLLRQDLRYAARTARRSPGYTLSILGVTALGVSAATAVFSIADHVLLRPLPFPQPDRILKLWEERSSIGYGALDASPANYRDWKNLATESFESMSAYSQISYNLSGAGDPERIVATAANWDLFKVLGVQPLIGHTFSEAEDRAGAAGTVVLSHAYWRARFGGDNNVLGCKIALNGEPFTVIGVMPENFHFPRREVVAWTPFRFGEGAFEDRTNYYLRVAARLRDGATIESARAELKVIAARLQSQYPAANKDAGIRVMTVRDELPVRSLTIVRVLAVAAAFLLLIACSNLANLILARSAARSKEVEIRTAMGAGRERLIRQLLTESLFTAAIGGSAGLLLAWFAVPLLAKMAPGAMPIAEIPPIDWRVLAFALTVTLVTGVAAGILPALRTTRNSLSSRSATGGRRDMLRRTLVVVQVAASLALVVSTGLLVRALTRLHENSPGFAATSSTLVFRTTLPFPKYEKTATRERFYEQVLSELRSLPGVRHAGVMTVRPMGDFRGGIWPVRVTGAIKDSQISSRFVTPGLFRSLGVQLLRGRDFLPSDGPSSLPVAVVSQSFVDLHWPGESGLGRSFEIRIGNRAFTIVGVTADVRFRGFEGQSEPQMYLASAQMQDGWFSFFTPKDFVVSTSLEDPTSLAGPIRRIVNSIDPVQPVSDLQTITTLLEADTASRRVQLWVVGVFAAAAFLLAAVGIHGLLSFAVAQRTQEIGLRRALGAATQQIAGMVLGEAIALSALGCLIGAVAAYLLAQSMVAMLAGVPPADGWTIGMAAGVLTVMTIAGAILPASRAIRVDPAAALRAE